MVAHYVTKIQLRFCLFIPARVETVADVSTDEIDIDRRVWKPSQSENT